jgi:hypothetical protein
MTNIHVSQDLQGQDPLGEVNIRPEAREPVTDPTLGIAIPPVSEQAKHRLVVLGDSLSHGFQNFAIVNTSLSCPAMIARELGWFDSFRYPKYRAFGGIPFDLEYLARQLERKYGAEIDGLEWLTLVPNLLLILDELRSYWERGDGVHIPHTDGIMHNLAVAGFDIRDLMSRTADTERAAMQQRTSPLKPPLVNNAQQLLTLYVLESAREPVTHKALTPVEAARAHGVDGGIETLIVFIGANNALGTVVDLKANWSGADYNDPAQKHKYNVWEPSHFRAELQELQLHIRQVNAQHVIWCTVPHVTIAPITRGIGGKMQSKSPYFSYYTRPWIDEARFTPDNKRDPYLTGNQARVIDSAIDMYNDDITEVVRVAREEGRDWLLLDAAGLLDRLAFRRYVENPETTTRPKWWTPYPLPPEIAALNPPPDSQFLASGPQGRTAGGLISVDGVHPTTITYAMLAQEFLNVMQNAGVKFYQADGVTERSGPIRVNFDWAVRQDTLISNPLKSITNDLKLLGLADELLDWVNNLRAVV